MYLLWGLVIVVGLFICLMIGYIISVKSLSGVKLLVFLLRGQPGVYLVTWDDHGFGRLSLTFFLPDHTKLSALLTYWTLCCYR